MAQHVKRLSPAAAMITVAAVVAAFSAAANASATQTASACGYYTNVSLFGGPSTVRGCGQTIPPGDAGSASPSIALPANSPRPISITVTANGALAQYGPAVIFGGQPPADPNAPIPPSGPFKLSINATTAAVTSSASVKSVGPGPLIADSISSQCAATSTRVTGSTAVANGAVVTATDSQGNPTSTVAVPANPSPNYTVTGEITTVGDTFKVVFNEQVLNSDGSHTVTGAHMYLLGPVAVGDAVIAQSRCGA